MSTALPWQSRWSDVLTSGLRSEADLRWFTSTDGFLTICRDLPLDDLRLLVDSPAFDDLLADLDDRSIAFPGPLPSERARALAEVALTPVTTSPTASACRPLLPAGADPDEPGSKDLTDLLVADLRSFWSQERVRTTREMSCPIVVSHHAHGDVVLVAFSWADRAGLAPDLVAAPFQRVDERFAAAAARAVEATRRSMGLTTFPGLRYQVLSRRTGLPVDAIGGPSVGLGAAVAVRRLLDPSAPPLDPEWVFTGDVDADGGVESLLGGDGSSEYGAKVSALTRGTLVHPAVDRTEVERRCETEGVDIRLVPVTDVAGTEELIARHVEGRRAYERALDATVPTRRPRSILALGLLSGLMIAAAVAAASLWYRSHQADTAAEEARAQAAGIEPLTVTYSLPGGGQGEFQMDRTEVTNKRYKVCMIEAGCPEPSRDLQARSIDDPANADFPVTGIDARAAAIFCQYARGEGWGLPTLEQFVAATLDRLALANPANGLRWSENPSDTELPAQVRQVDSPQLSSGGFSYLWGNVSEWTRSDCEGGVCRKLDSILAAPVTALRVFGISYDLIAAGWEPSIEKLTEPRSNQPDSSSISDIGLPSIGFRCASTNS